MSAAAPFARFVHDYDALVTTLRERSDEMEIARLELDRLSGLPDGWAGKCLSKSKIKSIAASLGPLLTTLGLILVVVEDPAARDKTLARRKPFDASNRRVGNHCNSKKPPDAASPAQPPHLVHEQPAAAPRESTGHAHLRVIQKRGHQFG